MGNFKALSVGSIIGGSILLVIAFQALAVTIPEIQLALGNLSAISGLPFASLFSANGIIILALLGAVLMGIVAYLGFSGGSGR